MREVVGAPKASRSKRAPLLVSWSEPVKKLRCRRGLPQYSAARSPIVASASPGGGARQRRDHRPRPGAEGARRTGRRATGSKRPMHIGRLGVQLGRGRFVVEDLSIDGMRPGDRPWLVAKRIEVSLTWSALFHREVLLDSIEMTTGGWSSRRSRTAARRFPRFTGPPRPPRTGPSPVVTTLAVRARAARRVRLQRLRLALERRSRRNLDVNVAKADRVSRPRALLERHRSPSRTTSRCRATWTRRSRSSTGKVMFERIDLITDGAGREHHRGRRHRALARADLPGEVEDRSSPQMREIFFARGHVHAASAKATSPARSTCSRAARELKGKFYSAEAGVNDYRFPNLEGDAASGCPIGWR